jgi:hypothetical protein
MGDVPVPWADFGTTGGLFSGPLASSLAVRSVRIPLGERAQGTEILPSITLATHNIPLPKPTFAVAISQATYDQPAVE